MSHWGVQLQRGEISTPRGEFTIITNNGKEKWIDLSATVIELVGKPAFFGIALDCTERKHAEFFNETGNRIIQAADRSESLKEYFTSLQTIITEIISAMV